MNKTTRDVLVVSFALFSMFFGAGNVIFPPFLGLISGKEYLISTLGFVITGAGLPILGIVAISKAKSFENFAGKVAPGFATLLGAVIMIMIGPLLAIPKTGALTYEVLQNTVAPGLVNYVGLGIFFIVTIFFSLNENSVIDKLGAILTPVLLISLIILIVKGFVSPIGNIVVTQTPKGFIGGFVEGYQTMDAIAAIMFAFTIIKSINEKGYVGNQAIKLSSLTGVIAGCCLALIYVGLSHIGATASTVYPNDISRTQLLISASQAILGNFGIIILAMIISLACLTTSVGLTTTAALYFRDLSKGKLNYKALVLIINVISFYFALNGVDKIVAISGPILSVVYPVAIILMLLNVFGVKRNMVYSLSALPTLVFSALVVFLPADTVKMVESFYPMFSNGFGWIPIAVIGGIIGYFISPKATE